MLADRIATIEAMSARERKVEWRRLTKSPPPPAFGSGLLARALAYREQEKAFGGLANANVKRIRMIAMEGSVGTSSPKRSVRPGTWLSRTWHGEVHQVIVVDDGVEYRGKRYASLSAVARKITGARWSGPRFFGLTSPRLETLGVTTDG
ncbi:DUF2924 domain-containing protein [Pontixanthobacter aquaemixtae]|uniref:DUF2924 domain-containing protein n=1 Tax=Pontixanthobacter aquaemixtae TaxID=1958940 RepID=A0A844ZLJ2_9SPHN|nr:DUF2924 domain-containing protein [Pontixanthobacter aquaemixtae]MXO89281.1 DUF2924 domain-containing protein [Pontixanthobacter aquaemixtae]